MKIKVLIFFFLLTLLSKADFSKDFSESFEKLLTDKSELKRIIEFEDDSIKMEAIKFLLRRKGDTNINTTWYGYTDPETQKERNAQISTKNPELSHATNQVVALYLISAIYYSDPMFCKKIEILYVSKDGTKKGTTNLSGRFYQNNKPIIGKKQHIKFKYRTVDNKIINQIFFQYETWFAIVQKEGLGNAPDPLDGKFFSWK